MNCFSDHAEGDVEEIKIEPPDPEDVATLAESVSFCTDDIRFTDGNTVIKKEEEDFMILVVNEEEANEDNFEFCASSEIINDSCLNREQLHQANVSKRANLSIGNDHDSQTSFVFSPSSNRTVTEFDKSASLLSLAPNLTHGKSLSCFGGTNRFCTDLQLCDEQFLFNLNQKPQLLSTCSSVLKNKINQHLGPPMGPTTSTVFSGPLYFEHGTYDSLQDRQLVLPSSDMAFSSICLTERFPTEQPLEQYAVMLTDGILPSSSHSSESKYKSNLNSNLKVDFDEQEMVNCDPLSLKLDSGGSQQDHQLGLPGEMPFSCTDCPEKFCTEQLLKLHSAIHSNQELFPNFPSPSVWRRTQLSVRRSNKKNLLCTRSSKSRRKANLNLEPQMGVLSSTVVSNRLRTKLDATRGLKDHQSVLTREMLFSCTDCAEKFHSKKLLKKHLFTHSDRKSFSSRSFRSMRKTCLNVNRLDPKPLLNTSDAKSVRRSNRLDLGSKTHLGELQPCQTVESVCAPSQKVDSDGLSLEVDSNGAACPSTQYSSKLRRKICSNITDTNLQSLSSTCGSSKLKHKIHASITDTKLKSLSSTDGSFKLKRKPRLNATNNADLKAHRSESRSRHTTCFKSDGTTHAEKILFSCPNCTVKFKTKNLLRKHSLRIHSKKKRFSCPRCSSKFRTKSKRKMHMASQHAHERPFPCAHCSAAFKDRHTLKRHRAVHLAELPFLCECCGARFKRAASLRKHLFVHMTERKFSCAHCCFTFKTKNQLKRHLNVHSEERVYHCCDICGAKFTMKGNLVKHFKKHYMPLSALKPFSCLHCDTRFYDRTSMRRHAVVHTGEKAYSCEHCDAMFQHRSSMLRHTQIRHGTRMDSNLTNKLPYRTYSCDVCSATLMSKSGLMAHSRVHSDERPFSCPQCSATFKRENDVKQHLAVHSNAKPFSCELCPAAFKSRTNLKHHLRTHSADRPFSCPHCPTTSKSKGDLKKHLLVHSNEKPFPCPSCPLAFKTNGNLLKHLAFHSGEKSFICEHCAAAFYNKTSLKRHLVVHSDEKPFSCEYCEVAFKTKREAQLHEATHTNIKPFSCKHCRASFVMKSYLTQHLIVHSSKKQFACQHCTATFKTKGHLKNHSVIHLNEKPHSCPQCLSSFRTKGQLKTHILTHSNEKLFPCQLCTSSFKTKGQLKTHVKTHSKKKRL